MKLNNLRNLQTNLRALEALFKELLEQLPEETAKRVIDGYSTGRIISLAIGPSDAGVGFINSLPGTDGGAN